ncbi:MAG: peptide chain release factor N(5)-glutamine methyltransferase [Pseudodesulfovibrio sp.]|nr:peptide chain release factor N(5)-glutamine methyltransferase [Pseudodesulfovibrio sp.]
MASSVRIVLQEGEALLHGVDSPRLSAELLLAEVVGCSRLSLVVDYSRQLSSAECEQFRQLVSRRATGEPLAYIIGMKEFYGLDFQVTPDVLIPRPETEHIVEEIERLYDKDKPFHYADLGTGSGILAVTVAVLFPKATGVAADISRGALHVASSNAVRHDVANRLDFLLGDFTTRLFDEEVFDLILSNPPYVTEAEYDAASHEVTGFEPVGALVSGVDGLDHVRAMLGHVLHALKPGGYFLMEIGCDQGREVEKILTDQFPGFEPVVVKRDIAGLDRVLFARKK